MLAETTKHETKTAVSALRALRAADTSASPTPSGEKHTARIQRVEMDALSTIALCVRSEALRRAIREGITLREEEYSLQAPHTASQEHERDLRVAGAPQDEIDAATEAERIAEQVWLNKRREVEAAAEVVSTAPFADFDDVLARAQATALLLGTGGDPQGLPDCDQDVPIILNSYRSAIEEVIARTAGRTEWDDAVADARSVEGALSEANSEWDAVGGSGVGFKAEDHPELNGRINRLYQDRDRTRTTLLALAPPDVEGLLFLMEVVFDHAAHLDVGTYERRATMIGNRPLLEEEQWQDTDDSHRRAFALVAHHAARLRDLQKPRDWQEAMRDIGGLHPNARDAVHRACEAGMDLADLKNIQLAGAPEESLPTLLFVGTKTQHWVRPTGHWEGQAVERSGAAVDVGAPQ